MTMRIFKSFINILTIYFIFFCFTSCESLGLWEKEVIPENPFEVGDNLYFSLQDININSATYGEQIGPQNYNEKVVLVYFTTNET